MKRILPALMLALVLSLGLGACAGTAPAAPDVKLDGGTWTAVADQPFHVDDYAAPAAVRTVPADWVLPEDLTFGENTRIEVCGNYLLYGAYEGSALNGFTVVRYDGEGTVTPVYQFTDGVTVTWQSFFHPAGEGDAFPGVRLAFPWMAAPAAETWSLRVVDLDSGKAEDLTLPEGAGSRDLLLCLWNRDLTITAVDTNYDDGANKPLTWTYAFPTGEEAETEAGAETDTVTEAETQT